MKDQTFGVEVEFLGITRRHALEWAHPERHMQSSILPHDERLLRLYFLVHDVIDQLEAVLCGRSPEHYFACRAYKRNDDDAFIGMNKMRCPCEAFRAFVDVFLHRSSARKTAEGKRIDRRPQYLH